jgi:prepilin-type N-terminal cleavage/methylation domain-containing protein
MRRQDGFTLIEVLVASSVMMVVLMATLGVLDKFVLNTTVTNAQNDAQDVARNGMDQLTRELRNHAAAASDQQLAIDKVTSYDIVLQTIGATKPAGSANERNSLRVRYCLDSTTPANERIWRQTQTWTTAATPALPSTAACPDPAWTTQTTIVDHLVNRNGGQDRPVWRANGADTAHTSAIGTRIYVDVDPNNPPLERELQSTVAFRNVNQAPVADFEAIGNANGTIVLNASGSYDPEGERVSYTWLEGTTTIGQGLAFTWEDPTPGSHTVALVATDASGVSQTVTKVVP